jgi:hypothetical protein
MIMKRDPGYSVYWVCGRFSPPQIEAFDETEQIDHKCLDGGGAGDSER